MCIELICVACDGKGYIEKEKCNWCNGTGFLEYEQEGRFYYPKGRWVLYDVKKELNNDEEKHI